MICFEICTPSLFSPSLLCGANFKIKHALIIFPNNYAGLDPGLMTFILSFAFFQFANVAELAEFRKLELLPDLTNHLS